VARRRDHAEHLIGRDVGVGGGQGATITLIGPTVAINITGVTITGP
jgi:hypothetical protein